MKVFSAYKTILIMDESAKLIALYENMCKPLGKELRSFQDETTFQRFLSEQEKTDFLLILIYAPESLEPFENILKLKGYEQTPTVLFLSENLSNQALKAYDLGANAVVVAPKEDNQLQNALETTLAFWADLNLTPTEH